MGGKHLITTYFAKSDNLIEIETNKNQEFYEVALEEQIIENEHGSCTRKMARLEGD